MNERIAARVLARLKVMFPSFASQMNNDSEMMMLAVDEWATGLQGLSTDAIQQGLEAVRRSGATFPPSLPEFVALCKQGSAPCHQEFLPAPEPEPIDPEKREKMIGMLRDALAGKLAH